MFLYRRCGYLACQLSFHVHGFYWVFWVTYMIMMFFSAFSGLKILGFTPVEYVYASLFHFCLHVSTDKMLFMSMLSWGDG